jgi:hypothetical protein
MGRFNRPPGEVVLLRYAPSTALRIFDLTVNVSLTRQHYNRFVKKDNPIT